MWAFIAAHIGAYCVKYFTLYSGGYMAFISRLVYRSYKRVISVLYSAGRLGIACGLSPCYALIWRLYAVVWRTMACIWRCIAWAIRSWPTV